MFKGINVKNILIGLVVSIASFIFYFLLYLLFSKLSLACLGITNCQEWISQNIFFNILLISWVSTLLFMLLILNRSNDNKFRIFYKKIYIYYIIANVVFLFIMVNSYVITTNEYIKERTLYNFFSKEIYWKDIEAYGIKNVKLRLKYSSSCEPRPYLILKTETIIPLSSQTGEIPTSFLYYLKNKLPEKKILKDECK